jgi:coenzyme F420-dependent glucose-6-phosphate dehydrogenase
MLQFGWKAGTEQFGPQELLEFAVAAEEASFDAVSASDHFHPWAEQGEACFVWSWLGAAAARTRKIVLGTGVTCPILRYHPSIIAQACATLATLAPNRFFLGLGTGEALNEYSAVGEWPEYDTRQQQLAEAIRLMQKLWEGGKVTHEGEHYRTHQAKLYTLPEKPIPVYISSLVPNSAHFAGKHGDGLVTVGGEEPETYKDMLAHFEAGAREAGRDASKMPKLIELQVDFTADRKKAIEARKAYWAGAFVPAMFTQRLHTPELSEANGKVVGDEIVEKTSCISEDPEEHVKYIRHYVDLGFDRVFFHSAASDQKAFIKAYGSEVLPRLRSRQKSKVG